MRSSTARSLQFLRDTGATARVVEQWIGFGGAKRTGDAAPGVRRDLWGADILAVQGRLLMAVQSTSGSNHSSHVRKSLANPEVRNWIDCGVAFYVYSWLKSGARGKRKLWPKVPRITQITIEKDKMMAL